MLESLRDGTTRCKQEPPRVATHSAGDWNLPSSVSLTRQRAVIKTFHALVQVSDCISPRVVGHRTPLVTQVGGVMVSDASTRRQRINLWGPYCAWITKQQQHQSPQQQQGRRGGSVQSPPPDAQTLTTFGWPCPVQPHDLVLFTYLRTSAPWAQTVHGGGVRQEDDVCLQPSPLSTVFVLGRWMLSGDHHDDGVESGLCGSCCPPSMAFRRASSPCSGPDFASTFIFFHCHT